MRRGDKGTRRQGDKGIRFASLFVLLLAICLFCLSFSAEGYMLSVGHLPPLRSGRTVLLITDLSGSGPAVNISFRDEAGHEMPSSPIHKLLPPRGKIQIDVENYLQTAGTITLESSNEQIVGEYWQIHGNGTMFMLPFQCPDMETRYFANCFRSPFRSRNYLVFSDPCGSGPLVQMTFYSKTGKLMKSTSKLLCPYGTLVFEMDAYAQWDTLGKISISSPGGSIVSHYRQLCYDDTVLAVPARLPAEEVHIDDFSAVRSVTGNLIIVDASAEGPVARIQFRNDRGMVLYEREILLPPNGAASIDPADHINDVFRGTISISSESEIIADYWERNQQAVSGTPAVDVGGSVLFISHFFPLDDVQHLLSLLNTGQESARVEVQFYADNGRKLRTLKLFVERYRRVEEFVEGYFGGACSGTIIIDAPSAGLIVTSQILDVRDHKRLGKTHAQIIR